MKKKTLVRGLLLCLLTIVLLVSIFAMGAYSCSWHAYKADLLSYLGAITRAQPEYFATHSHFSPTIEALNLGIPQRSQEGYEFRVEITASAALTYGTYMEDQKPCNTQCLWGIPDPFFPCPPNRSLICFFSIKRCYYQGIGIVNVLPGDSKNETFDISYCIQPSPNLNPVKIVNGRYECPEGSFRPS